MDNQFLSIEPKKDTTVINKRQVERGMVSKAIYVVTDLFPKDEPLRSALRIVAVDILKDDSQEQHIKLKNLLTLSAEIGIVSETNVKILLQAIGNMKGLIIEEERAIDIGSMFDASSKKVEDGPTVEDSVVSETAHSIYSEPAVANIKRDSVSSVVPKSAATYTTVVRSSAASLQEDLQRQMAGKMQVSSVTTLDIGTRRKKILEVVKAKGQATIHEFIESIQGCSSKTIQRELTSLVLSGTLKKTGERRWSKYSLR